MDVLIEEFFITESWKGIDVKKSLNQSRVHVKNAEGKYIEYGLLGHQSMCLSGLCGSPNELGEALAEACSEYLKKSGPQAIRGKKVTFVGAPLMEEDEPEQEEESEEE